MNDSLIDVADGEAGRPFGMTAEQMLRHVALGNVPHPDAHADICGATDPRDDTAWCVRSPGHGGDHNRYDIPPGSPER